MKLRVPDFGEFDMPAKFTFREMHLIKEVTKLRAGEVYPALEAGDSDVLFAFALVAIKRSDKFPDITGDQLLDLTIDEIDVIVEDSDTQEGDDGPPDEGDGVTAPLNDPKPPPSPPATGELRAITG